MPRTRRAAAGEAFDLLPDEVLQETGARALANELYDSQQLLRVSKRMWTALQPVRTAAKRQRLRWMVAHGAKKQVNEATVDHSQGIVIGSRLPTKGISSWKVRVAMTKGNFGNMHVGVLDDQIRCGWALQLGNMSLRRVFGPSPTGFPDGDGERTTVDGLNYSKAVQSGRAPAPVIEVVTDHDAGTLSFRVTSHLKDGPLHEALNGFPKGAALRIFAFVCTAGDKLSLVQPYYNWAPLTNLRAHARKQPGGKPSI